MQDVVNSLIIEIFKKYKDMNNNSKLILVGDGKLRTKIEKQIKKNEFRK